MVTLRGKSSSSSSATKIKTENLKEFGLMHIFTNIKLLFFIFTKTVDDKLSCGLSHLWTLDLTFHVCNDARS